MARPKEAKIRIKQRALIQKADKTRVAPTKVPNNGAVFKVRVKKKND